jgi:hypothetical protein
MAQLGDRTAPAPWLLESATQVAQRARRAGIRLAGNARGMELAQPFDLALAGPALAEVSLHKRELVTL